MKSLFMKIVYAVFIASLLITTVACGTNSTTSSSTIAPGSTESDATANPQSQTGPVTVSFLLPNSQVNYGGIKDIIAKWELKTGNKIDLQAIQDDQYDNIVKTRLAGKIDMDIFKGTYVGIDPQKYLLEIPAESFDFTRIDPKYNGNLIYAAKKFAKGDDKYYSYPSPEGLSVFGIWYNKQVFADLNLTIPKTFDEFDKVASAIKAQGITPVYFAGKDSWTMLQHLNTIAGVMAGVDTGVADEINKNQLKWVDIPEFTGQVLQLEQWIEKGYVNKDLASATYEMSQKALAKGQAAMVFQGSWFLPEVMKQSPSANIGYFLPPTEDGKSFQAVSDVQGIFISKNSKHVEAALDFLKFLDEPEQALYYLSKSPGISPFKDVSVKDQLPPAMAEANALYEAGQTSPGLRLIIPEPFADLVAAYSELLLKRVGAADFIKQVDNAYMKSAKQAKLPGF
ncbi:ABC transporter substrate-binding protein [Paenibacillus eucommiae]|uniref:Raffinose/stachyose/melibiose transport system substrate-binding protein n=1 Tax=Paenibacillus eucommiae TaxID=1355755 RepID=A0ABS4IRH4_9BACL|nr:extracellular solute-binding protein [Paenibacillus eucommiae]MBP1990158.1 raffinose/stachyose/melibiose transport system substrate-binding protein [Paenibacillus eucommiae]